MRFVLWKSSYEAHHNSEGSPSLRDDLVSVVPVNETVPSICVVTFRARTVGWEAESRIVSPLCVQCIEEKAHTFAIPMGDADSAVAGAILKVDKLQLLRKVNGEDGQRKI